MSDPDPNPSSTQASSPGSDESKAATDVATTSSGASRAERREMRRWWIKIVLQPLVFLLLVVALLIGLGVAQRMGFLATEEVSHRAVESAGTEGVTYICPMLCTPPRAEPGRCPVCGWNLYPQRQVVAQRRTNGQSRLMLRLVASRTSKPHPCRLSLSPDPCASSVNSATTKGR